MDSRILRSVRPIKPPTATPASSNVLQRKCDCGEHVVAGGKCEACSGKGQMNPQRRAGAQAEREGIPPIVHEVLRSTGQPLETATRAFFEPRFGRDFSHVRVHTGAQAAESARAVNALSYTVGGDVVFSDGRYEPASATGTRLLAHELAHASQQGGTESTLPDSISQPGSRDEMAADQAAAAALDQDGRVAVASKAAPTLQRQADQPRDPREQIIQLGETNDAENRQRALDLIVTTYYQRPANFDGIVYDPNLRSTSPQDAETGPAPGQEPYGGRQRITIGPRFFHNIRSRYDQRVRTIGHELQHVSQRSPASQRTVGSTLGGIGAGLAGGALLGAAGLGIAALAGASLSGELVGGVLGGAAGLGGLIGGIADPFRHREAPIKDRNTREFLAIHWVVTAQVRGIQPLSPGQMLQNINQPGEGALDRYLHMLPEDQRRYRRQYEEILEIKRRLESDTRRSQIGDFPGPEAPVAHGDTGVA